MRRIGQLPGLPDPKKMSYAYYQPNPAGKSVGDCTVRAISKALGQTWEETYVGLSLEGFKRGELLNADSVRGPYLKSHGFTRHWMPDDCPDCYTVADFAADHPHGMFILSMPGRHVVTVADGQFWDSWDSWDSGGEAPQYYWTKER